MTNEDRPTCDKTFLGCRCVLRGHHVMHDSGDGVHWGRGIELAAWLARKDAKVLR